MYRSNAIACPACQTVLVTLEPSSIGAQICPACGGSWLGPEASVHVMRGLGDSETVTLAAATVEVAKRATVAAPHDVAGRACPVCTTPLMPINVADVVVDSCPAHGTWFDRDEVERVATACKKLCDGEADAAASGAPITFEGVLEGTAQIGYGITKAAVTLVLDLFGAIIRREERERNRYPYRY